MDFLDALYCFRAQEVETNKSFQFELGFGLAAVACQFVDFLEECGVLGRLGVLIEVCQFGQESWFRGLDVLPVDALEEDMAFDLVGPLGAQSAGKVLV